MATESDRESQNAAGLPRRWKRNAVKRTVKRVRKAGLPVPGDGGGAPATRPEKAAGAEFDLLHPLPTHVRPLREIPHPPEAGARLAAASSDRHPARPFGAFARAIVELAGHAGDSPESRETARAPHPAPPRTREGLRADPRAHRSRSPRAVPCVYADDDAVCLTCLRRFVCADDRKNPTPD